LFTRLAVWLAGGEAVRRRPGGAFAGKPPDALILGGGADVGPETLPAGARKASSTSNGNTEYSLIGIFQLILAPLLLLLRILFSKKRGSASDPARDSFEREILNDAIRRGIPLLGICRGMQLINVELGGTLHPEVKDFYEETPQFKTVRPIKPVRVEPGSKIFSILGSEKLLVNALHHQAVDTLGRGLKVSARDDAGVVQAIEATSEKFLIGVQWHPEYLPMKSEQRALFKALLDSAAL